MEKMVFAAAVVLGVEVIAFVVGLVWSFVGGVLALCGLIAWFIFDVLAGPRNDE